jgi:hypothetical protein
VSINHAQRLEGVVKGALKDAALNEPFGYAVCGPSIWPLVSPEGKEIGPGAAWLVMVSIRNTNPGEGDIWHAFPIPGMLPDDESFRNVARGLLEQCRETRDQKRGSELDQARAAFKAQMKEAK